MKTVIDPLKDQAAAATAHTGAIASALGALPGMSTRSTNRVLDDIVDQIVRNAGSGKMKACPHLRNPQPIFVALAFPDRMVCAKCMPNLLNLVDDPSRADVCDACGKTGVKLFSEATIHKGAMILSGNICPQCSAA